MFRSELWKQAVRDLGYCVRCKRVTAPDPCHRNEGKGAGMKAPDCSLWAGCRDCHMTIDQGKDMTQAERRAESCLMIVRTNEALAARGFFDPLADTTPKKKFSPLRKRSPQNSSRTPDKIVPRPL